MAVKASILIQVWSKMKLERYKKMIKTSNNIVELELLRERIEKLIMERTGNEGEFIDELEDLLVDLIIKINTLKKETSCGYH